MKKKEDIIKVVYTDPDGREGTYHPKLGYIESEKPFDLPDDEAEQYIESGLLKKVERTISKPKTKNFEPGTRNPESKDREVKEDGNSTDR